MSPRVQHEIKIFLRNGEKSRSRQQNSLGSDRDVEDLVKAEGRIGGTALINESTLGAKPTPNSLEKSTGDERVDVILSDMCEPWAQTDGFYKRSLSDPYYRMMNTSGMNFRDHAGSMVRSLLHGNDNSYEKVR